MAAALMYCPNCKETREVTKKGFNKDGEQLWICKTCGKKFISITTPQKKKPIVKVTQKKAEKKTTEIIVNNNTIKTVPGLLTLDQAFDMVSSYFKEIAKDKAEIDESNNKRTIKFKVIAGSKG